MTEAEIKHIASTAAQEALEKFMLVLGVNVSTPDAKIELQKDFSHLRAERLTIGAVRKQILLAAGSSLVTGIAAAVGFYLSRGH